MTPTNQPTKHSFTNSLPMDWTRGHTIGRGSSATVSLATSRHSGNVFAVKSAELSQSEFLQREQRILSSLNSRYIVRYMGCEVSEENGKFMYNLLMEYISGGTLSDVIKKEGGGLDESEIRAHTCEILHGLEYLHSNGLVHCDIKGRNVLIGDDGGAKIADLGCARWAGEASSVVIIAGTPVFMAPEVARGEEQGFPADIWSLGCTMIEMATGCSPWPDVADPVSALYRIAFSRDVPEFPSFLSEEAKDFLSKCLKRDPRERWTVEQLLKHPFLNEPSSHSKQIQDSAASNSPTTVLDQEVWDSFEESETPQILVQHNNSSNSPAERIRQLSGRISLSSPSPANWIWEENWVTVRSNTIADESGISHKEELEFSVNSVFIDDLLNTLFITVVGGGGGGGREEATVNELKMFLYLAISNLREIMRNFVFFKLNSVKTQNPSHISFLKLVL